MMTSIRTGAGSTLKLSLDPAKDYDLHAPRKSYVHFSNLPPDKVVQVENNPNVLHEYVNARLHVMPSGSVRSELSIVSFKLYKLADESQLRGFTHIVEHVMPRNSKARDNAVDRAEDATGLRGKGRVANYIPSAQYSSSEPLAHFKHASGTY